MITALKSKIEVLTDKVVNAVFSGAYHLRAHWHTNTDEKLVDSLHHLAFIPARTPQDIQSKLSICLMLSDCDSNLVNDYFDAWSTNNFDFITANHNQAMRYLEEAMRLVEKKAVLIVDLFEEIRQGFRQEENSSDDYINLDNIDVDVDWFALFKSVEQDIKQYLGKKNKA